MTYNTHMAELNEIRNYPKKGCPIPVWEFMIDSLIAYLNELRAEAIAKVKELKDKIKKFNESIYHPSLGDDNDFLVMNQAVIDYLKTEWSIEEKDLL
jgi:hypothetical protein